MSKSASDAIQAVNRRFEAAAKAGDFSAIGALYTEQARLLPPGAAMITGRKAIAEFWAATAARIGLSSVKLNTIEIIGSGDTATEVGQAQLVLGTGSASVKYIVLWQRGSDGQWRLHADIWNDDPAAPA